MKDFIYRYWLDACIYGVIVLVVLGATLQIYNAISEKFQATSIKDVCIKTGVVHITDNDRVTYIYDCSSKEGKKQ